MIDIVVGWFMDSADMPDVRKVIGGHIIKWAPFWKVQNFHQYINATLLYLPPYDIHFSNISSTS